MMNWLSKQLKSEIRTVFEPRYQRSLTNDEVESIATNLSSMMEVIIKDENNFTNTKTTSQLLS
jgi:hypothetical protein